jgi:hypothetical protein
VRANANEAIEGSRSKHEHPDAGIGRPVGGLPLRGASMSQESRVCRGRHGSAVVRCAFLLSVGFPLLQHRQGLPNMARGLFEVVDRIEQSQCILEGWT